MNALSMKKFFHIFLIIFLLQPFVVDASMSGGTYEIYADSIGVSEAQISTNTTYALFGTGGESFATSTSGGTYAVRGGFQALERGILELTLDNDTLDFGALSTSAVTYDTLLLTVDTDSRTGYAVTLTEDGNLRSGSDNIDDVTDGTVSVGAEEYGVTTLGGDGVLSGDTAIAGTLLIASKNGEVYDRQTNVRFAASISSATVDGTYSHIVTFTVTVNP